MTALDRAEALERVERARVARLATIDAAGGPHIVPIVFAVVDRERIVSAIDHKPKSSRQLKRLDNIARNPGVALLVDEYDDDWSRLWWVRIDGSARITTAPAEQKRAVDALVAKYPQYTDRPPDGPFIVIAIESIVSWWPGR